MKQSVLLSKTGTVLLVIDVQDKFAPVIPRFDEVADNMTRLILAFQMFDMPIIVTEQYPEGLGQTVERLRKLFSFLEVVEKTELSATDNPHFWAQINVHKPDTFVVCGLETHICINQTVIKLIEKGVQVHVVADATASRRPLDHNVALRKMETAGAHIATTEMCLFELAEKAGTETFKYIQRMVKNKPSPTFSAAPKPAAEAKKMTTPAKHEAAASVSPPEEHPVEAKKQTEQLVPEKPEEDGRTQVAENAQKENPVKNPETAPADAPEKESGIVDQDMEKIMADIDKLNARPQEDKSTTETTN